MNDDELTTLLQRALTPTDADRDRLTVDFARRKSEEDALLWRVVFDALRRSQVTLRQALSRSQTAALAAYVKG